MAELARNKRVYSAWLNGNRVGVAGEVHKDESPIDMWVPPGDIKVIGAEILVAINVHSGSLDLPKNTCYCWAEVGMLPAMYAVNAIIRAYATQSVVELPTIGEHALNGVRKWIRNIMFPEGLGMATNEWHPVYLNMNHRNLWDDDVECNASALVYYVEL